MRDVADRFVVREARGPAWNWLPRWCVIDLAKQVRAAAYDNEEQARADAAERNRKASQ